MNYDPTFYTSINLNKVIKKDGIESEFENIVDRMTEIRDRLVREGFDSKFIIYFNNKLGKDYTYLSGYEVKDYLSAKIEFVII